ncbi:MAG: hypothetical protein ACJ8F3_07440 [Xanthobacteraceae bacterium]
MSPSAARVATLDGVQAGAWTNPPHSGPATFHFALDVADAATREVFSAQFRRELIALEHWGRHGGWSAAEVPQLQVLVSDRYKISKSLVPAWYGHAGHLEFPARRVMAGQAAIMHELAHVYFPNANRLLAEGLAIYLQAVIGGNAAFPNFGRPLHECAYAILCDIAPDWLSSGAAVLPIINHLDGIPTPNPLTLELGGVGYGEDRRGQSAIYGLVGSFAQFLIERRGLAAFHALYLRTPFTPSRQDAGKPERWQEIYQEPLSELAAAWRHMLSTLQHVTSERMARSQQEDGNA